MDHSAPAHQKDYEKICAHAELYSEGSDSLRACNHVNDELCDSPTRPGSALSEDDVGNLEPSLRHLRNQWEAQAQELLNQQPSSQSLKSFLRQVPWHAFQTSKNTSRKPKDPENPDQTKEPAYVIFGTYSHGGVVGVTRVTKECPWMCRAVMQVMNSMCAGERMTSVCVSCNIQSPPHRDSYNNEHSMNNVVPLVRPRAGGELWISGGQVSGKKAVVRCGATELEGAKTPLSKVIRFDARKWHATMPWQGDRVVMIGYSLKGAQKLTQEARSLMKRRGMRLPYRLPHLQNNPSPRQAFQEDSRCYHAQSSFESHHVGREDDQGRASEATPDAGRDSPSWLDQGTACLETRRDLRGERDDALRARCREDGEQVQDQSGVAGAPDRTPGVLHQAPELRSAEEFHAQVPHGKTRFRPRKATTWGLGSTPS